MSSNQTKRVVIIGGGITGLTAAFYAQEQVRKQNMDVEIVLLEGSSRLGGIIQTIRRDGFVIEAGPDSFLQRKTPIMDLTLDLGLQEELVETNPESKGASILHNNKLHPIPKGFVLGIPTLWGPLLETELLTREGKARAVLDLFIPDRAGEDDESLGGFLERRLGKEVAKNVVEPLLSGIYAGDTQKLSLLATFPEFRTLERKYGSLIKGMRLSRKPKPDQTNNASIQNLSKSMFLSYRNGLSTLIERLEEVLTAVDVRTATKVERIDSNQNNHHVHLENGETLVADSVIMTTPAFVTKQLLHGFPSSQKLENISYVSVANVVLAFNAEDVNVPIEGNGFVIPRNEHKNITACTLTSSKWLHTAPKGKVLIRCYVGHAGNESLVTMPDEQLVKECIGDLKEIMNLEAKPIFYEVTRLRKSMPQYLIGHKALLSEIRQALIDERPGIVLAGAAYEGVGIPDCVRQGKEAALQALDYSK